MRGAALGILLAGGVAHANTVRGSIAVPEASRVAEPPSGHWRVENGVLPVAVRAPELRGEIVVVLEGGARKEGAEPPSVTVELRGLKLDPRVIVAPMGATIEFKNQDRVPHTLYADNATSVMAPQPTPAGQTRAQKFAAAGEYRIRDQDYPHIDGTVVITQTPYAAAVDEKGNFKLDVPEGKYTLRVWYRGGWAVTQPLEVAGRTTEIAVQVPPQKRVEKARGE